MRARRVGSMFKAGFARSRMRKPPIPRAVPHRLQRERWAAAGACGVLALGHATRAAVDARHLAYLSVLDLLAVAATLGAGLQLTLVDDAISWYSAAGVAALVGAASLVSLTVGFPGTDPTGLGTVSLILLVVSAGVVVAASMRWADHRRNTRDGASDADPDRVTRPAHLRTRRLAPLVGRAPRGRARARRARRDPAHPAA